MRARSATVRQDSRRAAVGSVASGGYRRGFRWWKGAIAMFAVSLGAFLLYRTLSRYSLQQLVESVGAIPTASLLMSAGFAAGSYLCLSLFDYLGLRYVGSQLPYPKVALASFTALSIGHNIGLAFLSSGAVRYRFYTRWGLSPGDVAKVVLFCGITVGLGLIMLGGLALLVRPDIAQEQLGIERSLLLALGAACLCVPVAYLALAAYARKPLRFGTWSLEMPPLRLAVGQIVVGPLNFALVAACLHQALAAVTDVGYLGFASVYVIANTLGIVSHVPGGIGVVESVVIYFLSHADVIGPLLVFRFVYYLVPLALGLTALAASEVFYRRTA